MTEGTAPTKEFPLPHPSELVAEKTCWILGAGASYGCMSDGRPACPLTGQLVEIEKLDRETLAFLKQLTRRGMLGPVDEALRVRIESTIDIVRGLAVSGSEGVQEPASRSLRALIGNIAQSINWAQTEALLDPEDQSMGGFWADNYLWLAKSCSSNLAWSVVNLNYDNLMDWAWLSVQQFLIRECPQYEFWFKVLVAEDWGDAESVLRREEGVYVKPHGSLLLHSCQNRACSSYRVPVNSWMDREKMPSEIRNAAPWARKVDETVTDRCKGCDEPLSPLLLPPGRNKTKEESAFFGRAYDAAVQACTASDAWLILGYSVPDYDEDMVSVFTSALARRAELGKDPPRITIIDPNARQVLERLFPRLNVAAYAMRMTFDVFRAYCSLGSREGSGDDERRAAPVVFEIDASAAVKPRDVPCRNCGFAFQAEIWMVVDVRRRPDLLEKIRDGTLRTVVCDHCGTPHTIAGPLLVFDAEAPEPLLCIVDEPIPRMDVAQKARLPLSLLETRLGEHFRREWLESGIKSCTLDRYIRSLGTPDPRKLSEEEKMLFSELGESWTKWEAALEQRGVHHPRWRRDLGRRIARLPRDQWGTALRAEIDHASTADFTPDSVRRETKPLEHLSDEGDLTAEITKVEPGSYRPLTLSRG